MSDNATVLERRKKVFTLRQVGAKNADIAKKLAVTVRTIEDDNAWLRINAERYIKDFKPARDMGMSIKRFEGLRKMYWEKYIQAQGLKDKDDNIILAPDIKSQLYSLTKIQEIEEKLMNLKASIGLWPHASKLIPKDKKSFEQRIIELRKEKGLSLQPSSIIKDKIKYEKDKEKEDKKNKIEQEAE